jgi:hypothetical protein
VLEPREDSDVKRHPRIGTALGVAAALAMVGILLVWGQLDGSGESNPDARQTIRRGLFPDGPVPGGKAVSLEEAERSFPMAIYRPDSGFALDNQVTGAWLRTDDDPVLYISYESGAVVEIRPSKGSQSTTVFAQAQIKDGVPGEITKIQGVDTFLIPPDDQGNVAIAYFNIDDALILIVGDGDSTIDEVSAVTASVISDASAR